MPNKEAILDNVSMYSVNELVEYIIQGDVTFKELCYETDGEFTAPNRIEVEETYWDKALSSRDVRLFERYLMAFPEGRHRDEARDYVDSLRNEEEPLQNEGEPIGGSSAWESVDKTNIEDLKRFCREYPDDPHRQKARILINRLEDIAAMSNLDEFVNELKMLQADSAIDHSVIYSKIAQYEKNKTISTDDIVHIIREDNNLLSASIIQKLKDEGYLTRDDLSRAGIDGEFINFLKRNQHKQQFAMPKKLEKINKMSTEVYFWGIPSSGKSCALAAILSVANSGRVAKSMRKDNDCQGYGYMSGLSDLFNTNYSTRVSTLPEATPTVATYEMGFDLEDQDGKIHPLTFIDLAGELVRCMFYNDAKLHLDDDEEEALDVLTKVLIDNKTVNRKMHFFVIEYGAEDRKYKGYSQKVYLDAALRYIERTGIFKNDTDAVYLMISKVDKIKCAKGELGSILKEYVRNNYQGFYQGLERICKDNEINEGNVEVVPFSLGKVCFQDFCILNEHPSENVINKILKRSKGFKKNKLQKAIKAFKG